MKNRIFNILNRGDLGREKMKELLCNLEFFLTHFEEYSSRVCGSYSLFVFFHGQ